MYIPQLEKKTQINYNIRIVPRSSNLNTTNIRYEGNNQFLGRKRNVPVINKQLLYTFSYYCK